MKEYESRIRSDDYDSPEYVDSDPSDYSHSEDQQSPQRDPGIVLFFRLRILSSLLIGSMTVSKWSGSDDQSDRYSFQDLNRRERWSKTLLRITSFGGCRNVPLSPTVLDSDSRSFYIPG